MNAMSYNNWALKSDKNILETIGHFVQTHRLRQNKSQQQVAQMAGISRSTLSLLERGEKVRIDSLIQVLRVLDLLHVLNAFNVEDEISPIAYAKLKKNKRKHARPQKKDTPPNENLEW